MNLQLAEQHSSLTMQIELTFAQLATAGVKGDGFVDGARCLFGRLRPSQSDWAKDH